MTIHKEKTKSAHLELLIQSNNIKFADIALMQSILLSRLIRKKI